MAFRTKGGSVSASGRRAAEKKGETMPGTDKFPIRNKSDLRHAKEDIGRTNQPGAARAWINKRASELGAAPIGKTAKEISKRLDDKNKRVKGK